MIGFLYDHLDEFGDEKQYIRNSAEYALSENPYKGGYIIVAREKGKIAGAVILNKTHMKGYHPENYLVYIAVHKNQRGKGLGKKLLKKAAEITQGEIALHVEEENPARYLYEKAGFNKTYLEYRLRKA